ncbi:RCC1 domain-containing protein [Flavobacterium sp. 3HN19-14]|uniref:RCC1 domain-containing protein n=1 Tax=Flavobacterium sp. 3HN19-14 TaxID=3448133 RepID=UPI003EDFC89D
MGVDPDILYVLSPILIDNSHVWADISVQTGHILGLRADGTLWAWGSNSDGQIGNGSNLAAFVPQQIGSGHDWKSISAGGNYSFAIKTDGSLWAWGYNGFGNLGLGNNTDYAIPTQVGTDHDWKEVKASAMFFGLALKTDGSLWAWAIMLAEILAMVQVRALHHFRRR